MWTSAHGFHHYRLSEIRLWRLCWLILVLTCAGCLLGAVIWYFYNVFSSAVYSRILTETPTSLRWPTTIVCEKQVRRRRRLCWMVTASQSFHYSQNKTMIAKAVKAEGGAAAN